MNPLTSVSTLMSTNLITIMPSTTLNEARDLFAKHTIHHLPVVSSSGKLEGMLSHSDYVKLSDEFATTASEIMTGKLAKLEASDTVRTAASLFLINRFHALPVVEGDRIIGILTVHDLIRLIDTEEVSLQDYNDRKDV